MGAGKSILASLVIDTLEKAASADTTERIAFFYCDRTSRASELESPLIILRSLVKQLSRFKSQPIMDSIQKIYSEKVDEGHLNEKECLTLLIDLASRYPQTTFVIDGLDEAPLEVRTTLLAHFSWIIQTSTSLVKLFISSRRESDIQNIISILRLTWTDNVEDIDTYVKQRIEKDVVENRLLLDYFRRELSDAPEEAAQRETNKKQLKNDIAMIIIGKSQGM